MLKIDIKFIVLFFGISISSSCTQDKKSEIYSSSIQKDENISLKELDENSISFTEDGSTAFLTRGRDWQKQIGYLLFYEEGKLNHSRSLLKQLDTIYNGAISPSGDKIIYCQRNEEETEIWLVKRKDDSIIQKINLTEQTGITGGYFNWRSQNEIYFYTDINNGDLVKGRLQNDQLSIMDTLKSINTIKGTEFSPFIDSQSRYLIFTRYMEGNKDQQGFFISYNNGDHQNPVWDSPVKIELLPYGWGAFIKDDLFYYTDGTDIYFIPVDKLGLKYEN